MSFSINKLNKKKYQLPKNLNDLSGIKNFVNKNKNKKIIVVQGLGFVGAVMALVCSNSVSEEYAVIGIDLPTKDTFWKIKSINEGIFPIVADDPKIDKFFEHTKVKGNLYATYDPIAYQYADVIVVDINLDVMKNSKKNGKLLTFDINMQNFESAIESIGKNCTENVTILIETTVPPGTCERTVKPIIDKEFGKRGLSKKKYYLGHSYERVMPGPNYIDSIREYPRVYSGIDNKSADKIESFLRTIIDTSLCDLKRLEHTNATEISKVLENSYRAMNIAFIVEWSRFAEEAGVDLYSIVDAIKDRDTHKNIMYPGIGVGGYCLTKDPLLASWSRKTFFNTESELEMSINAVSTNDQMPFFAFERLKEVIGDFNKKKILFLGVSYRGDVGDTRFSPVELLVKLIKDSGAETNFHDPYIDFWQEQDCPVEKDLKKALACKPDVIIISTGHTEYKKKETVSMIMSLPHLCIFDTIGLLDDRQLEGLKEKHTISVLGRGDLK